MQFFYIFILIVVILFLCLIFNYYDKKSKVAKHEVFCGNCEYYKYSSKSAFYQCQAEQNKRTQKTYRSLVVYYNLLPEEKNMFNSCKWYEALDGKKGR